MEHYPRNTAAVSKWCNVCGRQTMHRVDDKRVGSCLEHAAEGLSRAQEKREKQRELDEQQPKLF